LCVAHITFYITAPDMFTVTSLLSCESKNMVAPPATHPITIILVVISTFSTNNILGHEESTSKIG